MSIYIYILIAFIVTIPTYVAFTWEKGYQDLKDIKADDVLFSLFIGLVWFPAGILILILLFILAIGLLGEWIKKRMIKKDNKH